MWRGGPGDKSPGRSEGGFSAVWYPACLLLQVVGRASSWRRARMSARGARGAWPFVLAFLPAVVLAAVLTAALAHGPEVYPGVDGIELADTLTGRRIGVVTHQAAVSRDGRLTTLVLTSLPDVQLSALFAPEHGLGDDTPDSLPARAPIYSLFGRATQPTRRMLSGVDVLVIDVQVGGG